MRKKPFLLSEEEAVNISMQAITEKRERIIFPRRMKIAVSILSKFPKSVINFLFLLTEKRKAMQSFPFFAHILGYMIFYSFILQ